MLADYTPITTIAVRDLGAARSFYEGVLGFSSAEDVPDGVNYGAGDGKFFVYESEHAGTNRATYVSFQVPAASFDAEIEDLRSRVEFHTFEMDGVTWSDGVASMEGAWKAIWLQDPDGNLIGVETAPREPT